MKYNFFVKIIICYTTQILFISFIFLLGLRTLNIIYFYVGDSDEDMN